MTPPRRKQIIDLPVRPMLEKVTAKIEQRNRMHSWFDPLRRPAAGGKDEVCRELGIFERQLWAWESGERKGIEFNLADKIMQRAGWLWWDVYTPESVRLPIFSVVLRKPRAPKSPRGKRWWVQLPGPSYGDRGAVTSLDIEGYEVTDWAMLARIEEAFTGEVAQDLVAA